MRKLLFVTALLALPAVSLAGDDSLPTVLSNAEAATRVKINLDYVWTLVAAALVFFMQAGFAMVETGFTRAKSAVNILMKNLMDFSMGSIFFWAIGFGIMFGTTTGFFLSDFEVGGDPWGLAFWMFQCVFAAAFVWAFGAAFILFKLIDVSIGLRVSEEEEMLGVDVAEHGGHAYNDFQIIR